MNKKDNIIDFMHIDFQRSEMIISQIEDFGVKKDSTVTGSDSNKTGIQSDAKLKIAIPFFAGGEIGFKSNFENTKSSSTVIRYDLNWNNAVELVNHMEQKADEEKASEIEIASYYHGIGELTVFDINILRNIVTDHDLISQLREHFPEIFRVISEWADKNSENDVNSVSEVQPAKPVKPSKQNKHSGSGDGKNKQALIRFAIDSIVTTFRHMPFQMVGMFNAQDGNQFWFSLNDEHFINGYKDVSLKHGSRIPGLWNVVGFVDDLKAVKIKDLKEEISDVKSNPPPAVYNGLTKILNQVRSICGRPAGMSALTVVAIYRRMR